MKLGNHTTWHFCFVSTWRETVAEQTMTYTRRCGMPIAKWMKKRRYKDVLPTNSTLNKTHWILLLLAFLLFFFLPQFRCRLLDAVLCATVVGEMVLVRQPIAMTIQFVTICRFTPYECVRNDALAPSLLSAYRKHTQHTKTEKLG